MEFMDRLASGREKLGEFQGSVVERECRPRGFHLKMTERMDAFSIEPKATHPDENYQISVTISPEAPSKFPHPMVNW